MKKEKKFSGKNLTKNALRICGLCSWPTVLAISIGLCVGFAAAKNKTEDQFKETGTFQTEFAKGQMEVENLQKNYLEVKSNYEKGSASLKQLETAKTQYENKANYINSSSYVSDVMQTTAPEMYAEWFKDSSISFISGLSIATPQLFPGLFAYAAVIDTDNVFWDFDPLFVEDDKKERKIAKLQGKLEKI